MKVIFCLINKLRSTKNIFSIFLNVGKGAVEEVTVINLDKGKISATNKKQNDYRAIPPAQKTLLKHKLMDMIKSAKKRKKYVGVLVLECFLHFHASFFYDYHTYFADGNPFNLKDLLAKKPESAEVSNKDEFFLKTIRRRIYELIIF